MQNIPSAAVGDSAVGTQSGKKCRWQKTNLINL